MAVSIVPRVEAHAAGFHACFAAVARERQYFPKADAPPLDRIRATIRQRLAEDTPQFVAVDGETVVGWCAINPRKGGEEFDHIGSLVIGILAPYRGAGIGARLLSAAIDKARAQGLVRIELTARADNERAIRLYEKSGFLFEARLRKAWRADGAFYDAVQMSLVFDEPEREAQNAPA
jgi:RimJ/RimL family protein N-acetyltransferase